MFISMYSDKMRLGRPPSISDAWVRAPRELEKIGKRLSRVLVPVHNQSTALNNSDIRDIRRADLSDVIISASRI